MGVSLELRWYGLVEAKRFVSIAWKLFKIVLLDFLLSVVCGLEMSVILWQVNWMTNLLIRHFCRFHILVRCPASCFRIAVGISPVNPWCRGRGEVSLLLSYIQLTTSLSRSNSHTLFPPIFASFSTSLLWGFLVSGSSLHDVSAHSVPVQVFLLRTKSCASLWPV